MSQGIDTNTPLTAEQCACLKEAGLSFVCRYYKQAPSQLTVGEAQRISAAGLFIVAVVERGFPTSAGYFSAARGLEDGAFALAFAQHISQPPGSPIYFAVDTDLLLPQINGRVVPYFRSVLHAIGDRHPVGCYGSGLVCKTVITKTAVTYSWLAMSQGWSGSRTFDGWNIKQTKGETLCNVAVDLDESRGHGGGWKLP